MKRWTIEEDCKLLTLTRQHFYEMIKHHQLNAATEFSKALHHEFESPHRDIAALLFRLKESGILVFAERPGIDSAKQYFRCVMKDDLALYDYSITFPSLKKKLHPAVESKILEHFSSRNNHQPLSDTLFEIAKNLQLNIKQVEKILIETKHITLNIFRQYEKNKVQNSMQDLRDLITKQTPDPSLIHDINARRAQASLLYHVHEHEGAEVVFSSDGTGFGKSYGVIQGYVEYIERLTKNRKQKYVFTEGGFSNLLFMSPHKSQIDLDDNQKEKILAAAGEIICVLARKDIADLNFVDWASGKKNRERYSSWYKNAHNNPLIGAAMQSVNYLVSQIDRCEEQLEKLLISITHDFINEKKMIEDQLKTYRHKLRNTIELACKSLLNTEKSDGSIKDYICSGVTERQKRETKTVLGLTQKKSNPKISVYEVYFEIIKQVLPFEVCQYLPTVLLMTTNKFDTYTYRLTSGQRNEGIIFKPVSFDLLVGGKLKADETLISSIAVASHTEQISYLKTKHFKLNPDCPFRSKNIRFTVVIDELHEAYSRLEQSCHVKLVKQENNLAHVISVVGRINNAVCSLEKRNKIKKEQSAFEQEKVRFISRLRELLATKCELSPGTTLSSMLAIFRDQLGAFEVNGDAAERIISITRNVFSFNAKMYVNEEGLKRIRLRNSEGDITRTELYYEVENDISDTNPTLHDLFQLMSAILAACAQITNRNFKQWVKDGGQDSASSQNTPFSQFIDAANNVANEVSHIFDRTTDENLLIDHFYTYLQPKTVFTMKPVAELNYVNKGAERTIILAFEMDLVKELPEAMLLRLLIGTQNKVIGLSATSGFTHTKNGNFSRHFLSRYAQDLGYKIVERKTADIQMLKDIRQFRAHIRKVNFEVFDAELPKLTDIYQNCEIFRKVYSDIFSALKEQLGNVLSNPYKNRQHCRELEALLLAAYEGKSSLILSLSGGFKNAFARAYRHNLIVWRQKYGMSSKFGDKQCKTKDQILTFTPFQGRHTIHLVFFDSLLATTENIRAETFIKDHNSVLVFMSTYNSAGTGLNYFTKYLASNVNDTKVSNLDVDFQRLILVNSSFYSEVINNDSNLNILPNYVSILKHYADDITDHKMSELSINFAHGDNYRLLMAEHNMSLFKVIVQALGRVERRDTLLNTEVYLPSDVMHNIVIQFEGLNENSGNDIVLESMSLLNYKLKKYCKKLSLDKSFSTKEQQKSFEKTIIANGRRIDDVHKRILKVDWINKVREGRFEYLELCNLFRDTKSFTNPELWLEQLQSHPIYAANPQMQSIHNMLFIERQQNDRSILLCHKRGADGLAHSDYSVLSDLAGGAREYRPELSIFPQYNKNINFTSGNLVGALIKDCAKIQKAAFKKMVPNPKLVPLLKGNMGEYLFDRVLAHYAIIPLDDQQVFNCLEPLVYEFFDRFIEVGEDLVCVDVKRWATHLYDLTRAEEMLEKSDKKIFQIRNIVNKRGDLLGQEQLRDLLQHRYKRIHFIYLNAAYNQNPNNLMWQDNFDHTIHYLNLFQTDHKYYQLKDWETGRKLERSKLDTKMHINPMVITLLKN